MTTTYILRGYRTWHVLGSLVIIDGVARALCGKTMKLEYASPTTRRPRKSKNKQAGICKTCDRLKNKHRG